LFPQTGHNIHSYLYTLPSLPLRTSKNNTHTTKKVSLRRFHLLYFIRNLFHCLVNFLVNRFLIDVRISF
jgi:hypothetical protein